MKYFVTGGTGFLGGHLVKELLQRGHVVIALARDPSSAGDLQAAGAQVVKGDITEKPTMREPMRGVDGVFHVAGWYKLGNYNKEAAYAINVDGTRNVLELMNELNVPKGVYTSTLAINSDTGGVKVDESYHFEGEHLSLYDKTKALAHHEVAEPMIAEGLPLVIVQPGLIYGPSDTSSSGDSIRNFLRGELPMLPKETAVCWGHVEDIVEGHILAMEKGEPGESYIIAGPCHTFIEGFDIMAEISGKPPPPIQMPPWVLKIAAIPMSLVDKIISLPAEFTGEGLRVIAGVTYLGDNSKARRELGYDPRPLKEGLRQSLPAYRAEVKEGK
ncbi:MAG: NAD-dependent epimerase/dehydratase family protein [Anaerolineales bacterium]